MDQFTSSMNRVLISRIGNMIEICSLGCDLSFLVVQSITSRADQQKMILTKLKFISFFSLALKF